MTIEISFYYNYHKDVCDSAHFDQPRREYYWQVEKSSIIGQVNKVDFINLWDYGILNSENAREIIQFHPLLIPGGNEDSVRHTDMSYFASLAGSQTRIQFLKLFAFGHVTFFFSSFLVKCIYILILVKENAVKFTK